MEEQYGPTRTLAVWFHELEGWVQLSEGDWFAHPDYSPSVPVITWEWFVSEVGPWLVWALRTFVNTSTGLVPVH